MNIFKNLLSKKPQTKQLKVNERDMQYEHQINESFNLRFDGKRWTYEGKVIDNAAQQLSDPKSCLPILKGMQDRVIKFDKVCITAIGGPAIIICNCKPPCCLVTQYASGSDELAKLLVTIAEVSGKPAIEYHGTWLLTMPI